MDAGADLETSLEEVRDLEVSDVADAIQTIGFSCTRCGGCCRGHGDDHTATVFPEEVRRIAGRDPDYDWRDVARPMPFGLDADGSGETIEWALQTDDCGDCRFLEERENGGTACEIYGDRPAICRTYPFSLALMPGGQPLGEAVERVGPVVAHECEGLGTAMDRSEAVELAEELKARSIRSIEEAIAVRDNLHRGRPSAPTTVVDSEGVKHPDGSPVNTRNDP